MVTNMNDTAEQSSGQFSLTKDELWGKCLFYINDRIQEQAGISHMDLEICIHESPACNWGFRGMHGDEIKLNYEINV